MARKRVYKRRAAALDEAARCRAVRRLGASERKCGKLRTACASSFQCLVSRCVPCSAARTDEERAAVQSALETAGVAVIAERRLSSLSGGERQRAMIAAAIAQETDILFLDEPTSYLDYAHQAETLSLIESLNKDKGKTIVMVTHDVNLALHGADELLAVKKGRTVWQGSPEGLLSGSLMTEIFGTEFEYFRRKGLRMPYVVPKGLVR